MINWRLKQFDELSLQELYAIMYLRQEVFVVEQNCAFIDADGKDQQCWHLSGLCQGELAVYARIVPPGVIYAEPSVGRIVSAPKFRHLGYGRQLMVEALRVLEQLYGRVPVKIEAQLYLKEFYESYDFVAKDEPYILDNILHIKMLRS